MRSLPLKSNHKSVITYHQSLAEFAALGVAHETAVRAAFQALLEACTGLVNRSRADKWKLVPEYSLKTKSGARITPDGALLDSFRLVHGLWEAKDTDDDLDKEIIAKFKAGYPRGNILFQAPHRAVLVQDGERVADLDISKPEHLVGILRTFFGYQAPAFDEWETAVEEFKTRLPEIGRALRDLLRAEKKSNKLYADIFDGFVKLCRQALNPNLADAAVEEMLIQHLLTERIFRKIFDVGDFMQRNNIAAEIEKVITALTIRSFSRDQFLRELDRFYKAIEDAAGTIQEFSEKQKFLNTVYEQFFQGFAVERADTMGIVYTPQEIVDFMLNSVEEILRTEFDRTLGDPGVHVIDPFVGTGNFMVNLVRHRLPKTRLEQKYRNELHCNEVMLLPYYVAAMNIEHTFYEQSGHYEPFPGICLVDTFETAEKAQAEFGFFNPENTERVKRQKAAPIFVVLGNPPYNAWQQDENDNNKNRKYEEVDRRVRETYGVDSTATLQNSLADPYIKAFRWASDRIRDEGVVAFVTNNGFVEGIACDGMRKHLAHDFDAIYVLDLGGNVRKNPKLSGTTHNVFGIQVGVSITCLIRHRKERTSSAKIYYHSVPADWRKEEKYRFLTKAEGVGGIEWGTVTPDGKNNWVTGGLDAGFDELLPIGSKAAKRSPGSPAVFHTYCNGAKSNSDAYVYSFDRNTLTERARAMVENYDGELARWRKKGRPKNIDALLKVDERVLKWIRRTKAQLVRNVELDFHEDEVRQALYRPFTKQAYYFEVSFNEDVYQFPSFFPTDAAEKENVAICVTDCGSEKPFMALAAASIVDLHLVGAGASSQCFPFYTYDDEDGARGENIQPSTLARFQKYYRDERITKWDIFHYVYAVLHHPEYRTRYAANLRRELPRIPLVGAAPGVKAKKGDEAASAFHAHAEIGRKLADLHVHYERAAEYPLKRVENPESPLDWRVRKMRLSKDKTAIVYNDFLTLAGVPEATFAYQLGNRSALEWVIDQYQVSTDVRSGITNDPNRADEPDYIVKLLGRVITVSLETQKLIAALPALEVL
jgi:predicted helicase